MATKRKAISKKTRFEIFKRDGFICQYCGAHPPAVILEPDHINPVANGGGNDMDNLVTACFDCNRGKSANLLTVIPKSLKEKAAEIEEREAQIAGYREVMQSSLDRIESDLWTVVDTMIHNGSVDGIRRDWIQSIKNFNSKLALHEVIDAAEIALARKPYSKNQRFAYFCGICWNKIRDAQ
ncbi:hypothetical protein GN109_05810 [Collimonas pratensis]|uniref:HNH endonuclease n=1 Tax=Collimonas pratensis TaxID=279113 RepID=UPI00143D61D0|nr:HNH endonuclease [Collimonas pratensis]NKI68929.1 hypothetical protein [Collimonas pratensis]